MPLCPRSAPKTSAEPPAVPTPALPPSGPEPTAPGSTLCPRPLLLRTIELQSERVFNVLHLQSQWRDQDGSSGLKLESDLAAIQRDMQPDDSSGTSPRETYRARIAARAAEGKRLQTRHVLLGYLRLALVLLGIAVSWCAFHLQIVSRWWVLAIFAAFVVVARRHADVLGRSAHAQRATRYLERGLARIEDRWTDLPARSPEVDTASSLFADDLDLFRRGGLFDLLDTARTSLGS